MSKQFEASTLRENERYTYWTEFICGLICRTAIRVLQPDVFAAQLSGGTLGEMELCEIGCGALRYERTLNNLRRSPNDEFQLSVLLEGEGRLTQDGREALLQPGSFVVYDTASPFTYEFPKPYRMLLLKIPRHLMLSRVPEAERLTSLTVQRDSSLGTLAARPLATSIIEVFSGALDVELAARTLTRDRQRNLCDKAKAYMRAHMDEAGLDLHAIALGLYTSPRNLSRALTTEGSTVAGWLWRERLKASHQTLREGLSHHVSDVALNCGFSNLSHFSRSFRKLYGISPSSLLRAH